MPVAMSGEATTSTTGVSMIISGETGGVSVIISDGITAGCSTGGGGVNSITFLGRGVGLLITLLMEHSPSIMEAGRKKLLIQSRKTSLWT